jgi:hypothetical protein
VLRAPLKAMYDVKSGSVRARMALAAKPLVSEHASLVECRNAYVSVPLRRDGRFFRVPRLANARFVGIYNNSRKACTATCLLLDGQSKTWRIDSDACVAMSHLPSRVHIAPQCWCYALFHRDDPTRDKPGDAPAP